MKTLCEKQGLWPIFAVYSLIFTLLGSMIFTCYSNSFILRELPEGKDVR
jgi:hypothetical protein